MMLFKKKQPEKLPYLDRIDELEKLSIVRVKGEITRDMIPLIEAQIQNNRRMGSKIDKNVLVDFAKVVDVDSATVAFHLLHLEEYHKSGYEMGFININEEMTHLLEMFKRSVSFKVYANEAEAIKELNK